MEEIVFRFDMACVCVYFSDLRTFWLVVASLKNCLRVKVRLRCSGLGVRIGFQVGSGWGQGAENVKVLTTAEAQGGACVSVFVCVCVSDLVSDHTDFASGIKEDGIPVKGSV